MKRRTFTKLLVGFGTALGLGPRVGAETVEPENLEQPPPLTKVNNPEIPHELWWNDAAWEQWYQEHYRLK